jgi:hypothetical protein
MIHLLALALLAVLALLLLRPRALTSELLRNAAVDNRRATTAAAGALALLVLLSAVWPDQGREETDVQGYAEAWYMAQIDPMVRQAARDDVTDGILTNAELRSLRTIHRRTSDLREMRDGVTRELSR